MTQDDDDIDMQIVADSYRVVSDIKAWDSMILTWDRKLAQAGYGDKLLSGEQKLRKQYGALGRLLSMTGLPSAEDPIEKAVASVNEPAMVVSDKLRVMAINAAGRKAFAVEQGQIAGLDWLHDAFRVQFVTVAGSRSPSTNQNYHVMRTRIGGGSDGYAEVFPVAMAGVEGSVTAVRELAVQWTSQMDHVLAEAFGLTAAETEIAKLIYLHADAGKVAQARGVHVRSVRAQLGSVFVKTDTHTQVQLVRLLSLLGMRLAAKPGSNGLQWRDPLGREEILLRPDGRRLAYSWMGASKGRPAVFVHGIVNGYLYPDVFEATLKANGVKLYVLSRPGCGNSDADRKLDPCTDHVETLLDFCRMLGLARVLVAGIHAAAIPIAIAAAQRDTPFSSVLAMGRFLPYSQKRFAKIAATPRALLWLANNAPWAAEVVGRHGWRALVQNGVDWYIERAYGDMPFDFKSTKQPEIAALMRNACAFTFLQDHRIFFDDLVLRKADLFSHLPSLRIPMHWMMGAADVYGLAGEEGFYDDEDIQALLHLNNRISMEKVPDAGELMPYQRPALVAQRICEMS
jgi:pimeloyl-ACP methyl ester carboxylesterase/DNA-binding CsgD family transcriptional regulator